MPVTFHYQPCLEPRSLLEQCARAGLPTDWANLPTGEDNSPRATGRPNNFYFGLGARAGEGWILLSRQALRAIDSQGNFTGAYDLVFSSDVQPGMGPETQEVRLKNLVILKADCLTPGARDQDESAYLVHVADRRHLINRVVVDVGYNCHHLGNGALLTDTLSGGSTAFTWSQLVEDLWNLIGTSRLGSYPGLPVTPSGTPDQIELWQRPGLEALVEILGRLGMALVFDPMADTFAIVEVGATDTAFTAALQQWEKYRHWDNYAMRSIRGSIPEKVRVLFRRLPHERGGVSPFYALDVADPTAGASGWEAGTLVLLQDDLCALVDGTGSITNSSDLSTRATARATEYYRQLYSQSDRLRLVYPALVSDVALRPGRQVQSMRFCDLGLSQDPYRGMVTEIVRTGPVARPEFPPVWIPPTVPSFLVQLVAKDYSDTCILYSGVRLTEDGCNYTAGDAICEPIRHVRDIDIPVYPPTSPRSSRLTTFSDDAAAGNVAWSSPSNAASSNDSYATATLSASQTTHYLKALGGCFVIPPASTITNVEARVEAKASGSDVADLEVKLVKGGVISGTSQHTGSALGTSDSVRSYSASPATWGVALTAADVNAADFGVALRYTNSAGAERIVYVDDIEIRISFTPAGATIPKLACVRVFRGLDGNYWFNDSPWTDFVIFTGSEDADGSVVFHRFRNQNTGSNEDGQEMRAVLMD